MSMVKSLVGGVEVRFVILGEIQTGETTILTFIFSDFSVKNWRKLLKSEYLGILLIPIWLIYE